MLPSESNSLCHVTPNRVTRIVVTHCDSQIACLHTNQQVVITTRLPLFESSVLRTVILMAQLFAKAVIYLPSSFSPLRIQQLTHLIESHGGIATRSPDGATHVVTNSHRFEGWQGFQGDDAKPVCTVRDLSISCLSQI